MIFGTLLGFHIRDCIIKSYAVKLMEIEFWFGFLFVFL